MADGLTRPSPSPAPATSGAPAPEILELARAIGRALARRDHEAEERAEPAVGHE